MAAIAPTQIVPHLDGSELELTDLPMYRRAAFMRSLSTGACTPGSWGGYLGETEPQALPAAPHRRALT